MPKPPILKSLLLRSVLSFGPETAPLELQPLNVLIGPNGSGKSNLIEALRLLQSAPRDLSAPTREGGGIREWLWKGATDTPTATVGAVIDYPEPFGPLDYQLSFTEMGQRLEVTHERLQTAKPPLHQPRISYSFDGGLAEVSRTRGQQLPSGPDRKPAPGEFHSWHELTPEESLLAQLKDPQRFPELAFVQRQFESLRFYRDWNFGPSAAPRRPQSTLLSSEYLNENAQNLGLVLDRLRQYATVKRALLEHLGTFYEPAEEIHARRTEGGYVQIFLKERAHRIPASRLSDGTLRWLCLLVILLHPSPPPLVCIEEPELGLHPDIIPTLVTLLREASERMQLIVTTHSNVLVDALNATPEAIVVCEKEEGVTKLKRLDRRELSSWLKRYTLGELWLKGELGGTRW